jgi:glycosyltransferase involved in cell wall biosynthesis
MHAIGAFAKPARSRLLWHVHDFPSLRPIMAPVLRMLTSRCALAVANSESVAADLRATCGSRLQVTTILNGVDLTWFRPDGPALDLDAYCGNVDADRKSVRVGLVATMAPWKGHGVFLRAFAAVDKRTSVRGYVVGGAIYETGTDQVTIDRLTALAESLGIADRICFTGYVRDVPAAMRGLDIIVHASTSPEPFGLIIAEAMACGRPVIVSRAGGAAEIAEGGTSALMFEPGDSDGLARRIEVLAADAQLRENVGRSGRRDAEARFDARRVAKAFADAYENLQRSIP